MNSSFCLKFLIEFFNRKRTNSSEIQSLNFTHFKSSFLWGFFTFCFLRKEKSKKRKFKMI